MLEALLEEIMLSPRRPPTDPLDPPTSRRDVMAEKLEELRRQDTTNLSALWALMQELMERDDVVLTRGELELGYRDVGAEEAFLILLTSLLEAAYYIKYPVPRAS